MANHPNRSKVPGPDANPKPELIAQTRKRHGLGVDQAAPLVHASVQRWTRWESGERRMDAAVWELFLLKIGERTLPAESSGV